VGLPDPRMSPRRPLPFALVCLDLDGTLIDPDGDPESLEALRSLLTEAGAAGTRLAYATGRGPADVQQLVAERVLARPDFLLAELGTIFYAWEGDGLRELPESPAWSDWDGPLVERLAAELPELRPRPPERSGVYKRSFYVREEEQAAVAGILERRLASAGIRARLFFVAPKYLHVIPAASGKEAALRALMERHGLAPDDVLVAGDSEVDRGLLAEVPHAILVGNAPEALKEEVQRASPHVYIATGRAAAGVLEGIDAILGR
jgi:sucrose-6F-phosphate phosphohydrolase